MTALGLLTLERGVYYINKEQLIKELEKYHETDNSASIEELCKK